MTDLEAIRAEIVTRRDHWKEEARAAIDLMKQANSELTAHDRAVALFDPGPAQPKRERAARRDIAALVLDALSDDWQTTEQLAKAIGCPPSRVEPALKRLGYAAIMGASGAWKRSGEVA
jgi:hypothetical protein